jgi:hypothetical protein
MGKYNKQGIRLYRGRIRFIDGVRFTVNSINVNRCNKGEYNQYYRMINYNKFGIDILCYKVYKRG